MSSSGDQTLDGQQTLCLGVERLGVDIGDTLVGETGLGTGVSEGVVVAATVVVARIGGERNSVL